MNKKCQAKDPSFCRFHSREAYKSIVAELERWKADRVNAVDFDRMELASQYVARFSLFKDATKVGFRSLIREHKKTMAKGSAEEKLDISALFKPSPLL